MNKTLKKNGLESFLLFVILTVGLSLRIFDLFSIPFTYDEFSALFRLEANSFEELIQKGVLTDNHPAGVQVFLYYYSLLFGTSEWVLKLPFILMGVACIYLIYRIAQNIGNRTAGLLAASFFAVAQFFVFNSQIARPYIFGLFFCLLAVFYWSRMIYSRDFRAGVLAGWAISAALAAYAHHLALLAMGLVGLTGLFMTKRKDLIKYILASLCAPLLYLPHIPVFQSQLQRGGIEDWLAKPDAGFLPDFLQFLLQYSIPFALTIGLILFVGIKKSRTTETDSNGKVFWPGLIWFSATFLIAFVYSIKVNSILRFSTLFFTTPLLLLWLFSLIRASSSGFRVLSTALVLLIGSFALIAERQHYRIFYESPYEYLVKDSREILDTTGMETPIIFDIHKEVAQHYIQRYELDSGQYLFYDGSAKLASLKSYALRPGSEYLVIAIMYHHPKETLEFFKQYFPCVRAHKRYYQGDVFLLAKTAQNDCLDETMFESTPSSGQDSEYWQNWKGSVVDMKADAEFGPAVVINNLEEIYKHRHDRIVFTADVKMTEPPIETQFSSALYSGDSLINWQSSKFIDFYPGPGSNDSFKVFHGFSLPDELRMQKDLQLKIFCWNIDRSELQISNPKLMIREGNHVLYGLYDDL